MNSDEKLKKEYYFKNINFNNKGYNDDQIRSQGRILGALIDFVIPVIIFIIVGIDYRLNYLIIRIDTQIYAGLVFLFSCFLILWAMMANDKFTAIKVDEKSDRVIVCSGPYRYIRHPGYAGAVLFYFTLPLFLGSLWAFIPGVINSGLILYYTDLEDKMLNQENEGYSDYIHKVPWRIIPGIW